jgi:hypothetical protein
MKQRELIVWDSGSADNVGVTNSIWARGATMSESAAKKSEKILLPGQD